MDKKSFLALAFGSAFSLSGIVTAMPGTPTLDLLLEGAADLEPIQTIIVAKEGEIVAERGYRGISVTSPPILNRLRNRLSPPSLAWRTTGECSKDPIKRSYRYLQTICVPMWINEITIGNLLSMQAGLGRTSGANYGRWVSNDNWVRAALAMPFEEEPDGTLWACPLEREPLPSGHKGV